jgi:hypothetical protein
LAFALGVGRGKAAAEVLGQVVDRGPLDLVRGAIGAGDDVRLSHDQCFERRQQVARRSTTDERPDERRPAQGIDPRNGLAHRRRELFAS